MHVDAAYGGFTVVTERGKRLLRGIERADSISLDAHKWFFQPYEVACLVAKDAGKLPESNRSRNKTTTCTKEQFCNPPGLGKLSRV